ncbi:MAG: NfeD family protein [Lachnospiraceae bacterium]|jgi:membrane protein implicated in regulation of membrane protease activity|nr:NfeD family protein [Lachnospiraceae bacterium]MBQ5559914.1 NfeD family protein [Lachnospiraceae bacterium]MCR4803441.1 NfeD family protein [Lachnospiraceae bacterium]
MLNVGGNPLLIWIVLLVVFLLIEIATLGLTTIWFAGGALIAIIAGALGASVEIQIGLFVIVSMLLLLLVRPSACRRFNSKIIKTNSDSVVGLEGKVIETIDNFNQTGCVSLDGKEWTARSADGTVISAGEKVTVNEISGVKLIVTKNEY